MLNNTNKLITINNIKDEIDSREKLMHFLSENKLNDNIEFSLILKDKCKQYDIFAEALSESVELTVYKLYGELVGSLAQISSFKAKYNSNLFIKYITESGMILKNLSQEKIFCIVLYSKNELKDIFNTIASKEHLLQVISNIRYSNKILNNDCNITVLKNKCSIFLKGHNLDPTLIDFINTLYSDDVNGLSAILLQNNSDTTTVQNNNNKIISFENLKQSELDFSKKLHNDSFNDIYNGIDARSKLKSMIEFISKKNQKLNTENIVILKDKCKQYDIFAETLSESIELAIYELYADDMEPLNQIPSFKANYDSDRFIKYIAKSGMMLKNLSADKIFCIVLYSKNELEDIFETINSKEQLLQVISNIRLSVPTIFDNGCNITPLRNKCSIFLKGHNLDPTLIDFIHALYSKDFSGLSAILFQNEFDREIAKNKNKQILFSTNLRQSEFDFITKLYQDDFTDIASSIENLEDLKIFIENLQKYNFTLTNSLSVILQQKCNQYNILNLKLSRSFIDILSKIKNLSETVVTDSSLQKTKGISKENYKTYLAAIDDLRKLTNMIKFIYKQDLKLNENEIFLLKQKCEKYNIFAYMTTKYIEDAIYKLYDNNLNIICYNLYLHGDYNIHNKDSFKIKIAKLLSQPGIYKETISAVIKIYDTKWKEILKHIDTVEELSGVIHNLLKWNKNFDLSILKDKMAEFNYTGPITRETNLMIYQDCITKLEDCYGDINNMLKIFYYNTNNETLKSKLLDIVDRYRMCFYDNFSKEAFIALNDLYNYDQDKVLGTHFFQFQMFLHNCQKNKIYIFYSSLLEKCIKMTLLEFKNNQYTVNLKVPVISNRVNMALKRITSKSFLESFKEFMNKKISLKDEMSKLDRPSSESFTVDEFNRLLHLFNDKIKQIEAPDIVNFLSTKTDESSNKIFYFFNILKMNYADYNITSYNFSRKKLNQFLSNLKSISDNDNELLISENHKNALKQVCMDKKILSYSSINQKSLKCIVILFNVETVRELIILEYHTDKMSVYPNSAFYKKPGKSLELYRDDNFKDDIYVSD